MNRFYPYLQNSYSKNTDKRIAQQNFLDKIHLFANQRQYFKITLLDFKENPIKELEGILSGGTLSKQGSSAIRRVGNLTCVLSGGAYDLFDPKMDFALNKKIFLEIGIKNDTDEYPEYPILWFPQGVFFISSLAISSNVANGVTLNIGLKDKMAQLSGDVGGTLPALVVFDEEDTILPSGGYGSKKVPFYKIIQELVHHYGGEDLSRIVIDDVPLRIKQILRWRGDVPLIRTRNNKEIRYTLDTEGLEKEETISFQQNDDVGYSYEPFVCRKELVGAPGESVVSVLTKIKDMLGNYEFFYDEYGIFHFREIRNYLNTTEGKMLLDEMSENQYLVEVNNTKSVYTFSSSKNITAISINPKYENIKNDFIIQGLRQRDGEKTGSVIRYHLAIESKPEFKNMSINIGKKKDQIKNVEGYGCHTDLAFYEEDRTHLIKAVKFEPILTLEEAPHDESLLFLVEGKKDFLFYWDGSVFQKVKCLKVFESPEYYITKDWRTELYLQGVEAARFGLDAGYYYPELAGMWPQVYNLLECKFYGEDDSDETKKNPFRVLTNGDYYLDFIDPAASGLGQYSVDAIGRRSVVIKKDEINCLFQPEIPNVILLNTEDEDLKERTDECIDKNENYSQVRPIVYDNLGVGGYWNGAFDEVKYQLHSHTNMQRTISITSIPAFYLEPNSRVTVLEDSTNTYDDFIITSINYTFGPGANMTVSGYEAIERI